MVHLTRVGVLRGGPSAEYEVSLNSGAVVLDALRKYHGEKYRAHDIFIDRKGIVHIDGIEIPLSDLSHRVDVVFNALHGTYGEDGKIQKILETHGIPFSGSGSLSSALGMNKVLSKAVFKNHGIKSPFWREVNGEAIRRDGEEVANELFMTFPHPAVVKPAGSGSSVGISIVKTRVEMLPALLKALEHGDSIMVEEMISGIEATCGVIEHFRDQELYALPPVEIQPENEFFDYEAKYMGKSREIVPANLPEDIKRELEELAKNIHRVMGLRHYSRSDFIIHPKRGIYALEVNTLPGLSSESIIPKALRAVGSDVHELVGHVLGRVGR